MSKKIVLPTIDGTENELGFDEVVDTISDAIEFGSFVEERLSDGLGFDDAIALIPQYPKLQEIYDDRKIFAAQFLDLTSAEAQEAVSLISARVGKDEGYVREKGVKAVKLTARAFNLYTYAKNEALGIYADARELVS